MHLNVRPILPLIIFLMPSWTKKLEAEEDTACEKTSTKMEHFQKADPYIYIGCLCLWGMTDNAFHTSGEDKQLRISWARNSQQMRLIINEQQYRQAAVDIRTPFTNCYQKLLRFPQLGKIKYYCCVKAKEQQPSRKVVEALEKEEERLQKKINTSTSKRQMKHLKEQLSHHKNKKKSIKSAAKKAIPIRLQIFINQDIFTEKCSTYSDNLKKLDNMQSNLNIIKASSQEARQLRNSIEILIQNELHDQKCMRGFLLYLMEKAHVKVLNRSFVRPPPKMIYFMRDYRKQTIGIITKNKRAERRIQNKIQKWRRIFQYFNSLYTCIGPINEKAFNSNYYASLPKQSLAWSLKQHSDVAKQMREYQSRLIEYSMGFFQGSALMKFLAANRKKILNEIGASAFEINQPGEQYSDDDSEDEEQNEASKKSMDVTEFKLMKKNEALMEKFETENKFFVRHPTPTNMISQLKPYQGQALQWMKYREGKITVNQLFQQKYRDQVTDFQFERTLSPLWQEVETINGEKFYVNYLTGEFTKQFHEWKSIKGGILADQMGLGKTVMTLSLLADENWQGLNLIVVPVAVLMQWKDEVLKHCGNRVSVYEFHSDVKSRRSKDLSQFNIVLITYATLGHQYKYSQNRSQGERSLFDYQFQRVILDEAHNIRGTNTQQFNAVMNLKSKYSWCLTGTLIQNSQQDLFAIFKFLRVEVFSEQPWWNQYIKNAGCTQAKMNVIQTVLRPIVLRRTKASTSNQGESIIELTKKNQVVIRPQFSKQEANIYEKLEKGVKQFFKSNVQAGRNYTHVFQIISKLRQFCCHPALIFGSNADKIDDNSVQDTLKKFLEGKVKGQSFKQAAITAMVSGQQSCVICITQPGQSDSVLTSCGHFFCEPCLKRCMSINPHCPICRSPLTSMSYIKKSDIAGPEEIKDVNNSSKVDAIMATLQQIFDRGQKCVIFTQWIKVISILEGKLQEKEAEYALIQGSMTPDKRQKAIRKFRDRPTCNFLIVSIRAGATGLNLAFANNVVLCDPWWNPAHEDQAVGRVHRLGQTKEVNVYRFIMKNSIEQRIQKMHVSKRILANQVMMQKGSLQAPKQSAAEELISLLSE